MKLPVSYTDDDNPQERSRRTFIFFIGLALINLFVTWYVCSHEHVAIKGYSHPAGSSLLVERLYLLAISALYLGLFTFFDQLERGFAALSFCFALAVGYALLVLNNQFVFWLLFLVSAVVGIELGMHHRSKRGEWIRVVTTTLLLTALFVTVGDPRLGVFNYSAPLLQFSGPRFYQDLRVACLIAFCVALVLYATYRSILSIREDKTTNFDTTWEVLGHRIDDVFLYHLKTVFKEAFDLKWLVQASWKGLVVLMVLVALIELLDLAANAVSIYLHDSELFGNGLELFAFLILAGYFAAVVGGGLLISFVARRSRGPARMPRSVVIDLMLSFMLSIALASLLLYGLSFFGANLDGYRGVPLMPVICTTAIAVVWAIRRNKRPQ